MNVVRLLLTFTFAFADLSNLFHCPLFDGSCSPILQVFNYLHHVLCSNGFICKLVNMIVPLFMKEICKICKVVIPAVAHEDGICKLSARICLFLDAPVANHHAPTIEG